MIGIALKFPAGRYHATPWGRHVNEGAVEWPPSPWRLLRAIVATWKRTRPDLAPEHVEVVVRALLEPPRFALPPASTGHTRHFMPWFKKGPDDKTLVFDAFAVLTRAAEVVALWPHADLGGEYRDVLIQLAENLNYLGRAESWCDMRLLPDAEAADHEPAINCFPRNGTLPPDMEVVRVLCADPSTALANDRFTRPVARKRRGKVEESSEKAVTYDPDWHLCAETLWLHQEKWSDPPGSRWMRYLRPSGCFEDRAASRRRIRSAHPKPQVVRFALDSTVLPPVMQALPVAEAARRALMSVHGRATEQNGVRGRSETLSGKIAAGRPAEGHVHAYYLPTDEDRDGRLDHITVVAEAGFDEQEMRAMDRLPGIRPRGRDNDSHPLRVLLLGYGRLEEYRPSPLIEAAREWASATPFIAPEFPQRRGATRHVGRSHEATVKFLTTMVRAELARLVERREDLRGTAVESVDVEPQADASGVFRLPGAGRRRDLRPLQFKRLRAKPGDDGLRRPAGSFRIIFPTPVRGPIALGHSAHFGMGLFVSTGANAARSGEPC